MWSYLLVVCAAVALAHGHGRLLDPPGRSSMWRAGFNTRANYDDDGLNCGGFHRQHGVNGGKCGICGDAYDASMPRPHERGGVYDSGIIAATYEAGSVVPFTVQISAHHKGYWEFRICTDPQSTEQTCFDERLVELEDGTTKYYPERGSTTYEVNYRIPSDLSCENCVLQWKYTCGNNWGVCENGTSGLGCGPQETFWACSDITVTPNTGSSLIPAGSLLLKDSNDLGLLKLLLSGYVRPTSPSAVAPQRKNSKRKKIKNTKKTKGRTKKKKVKPYKAKWTNYYWR